MASLNNLDVDKSSWLKWQIAVAVGAPIALGIGYWYVVKRDKQSGSKGPSKGSLNVDNQNKVDIPVQKSVAIESLQKEQVVKLLVCILMLSLFYSTHY